MKFRVFTIPCFLAVMITFVFTACEKEGPAGPAGPAGPQGPAGPTGATGPAGPAGTANVFYSNWLDVTFTGTDTTAWVAEINAPRLTDSILSMGEVKVYVNLGTAIEPAVVPLPLDAFAFQDILTPIFEVGTITLISSSNLSTTTEDGEKFLQYRYILIPGGTATGGTQGITGGTAQVNWGNYADVKNYLGLKD